MTLLAILDDKRGYVTASRSPSGQVQIDRSGIDGQKAVRRSQHGNSRCFGWRTLKVESYDNTYPFQVYNKKYINGAEQVQIDRSGKQH